MIGASTSPLVPAAAFSCAKSFFVAVLRAPILPASAIEPVLSRARVTRSRCEPHFAVEEPLTVILL